MIVHVKNSYLNFIGGGGENVLYIASLPLAHVPSPNYGQTEELIKEIKLTASKTNNELYK